MPDTAMQCPHDSDDKAPEIDHVLAGYMTIEELATELDMAVITLATWRRRQKGPPYVKVGRKILYSRTTVLAARPRPWRSQFDFTLLFLPTFPGFQCVRCRAGQAPPQT
jgi:hypothetical protein